MMFNKGDIETGGPSNGQLYPNMIENPQLRWAFIRKVYAILSMQIILTAGVAALVVFVRPIPQFLRHTTPGIVVYVFILILPLIILCPLYAYHESHPWNFLLLALFTIAMAFSVGMSCAFIKGRIILEAAILTSVVVVSLTLYTFWAVWRGQDFNFLGPFLFASVMVLIVFGLMQFLFPLGKITMMIYGLLASIIFCGFIIYDTDNLIKRFEYDEYIWASVNLYMDVIGLFLALLTLFRGAE